MWGWTMHTVAMKCLFTVERVSTATLMRVAKAMLGIAAVLILLQPAQPEFALGAGINLDKARKTDGADIGVTIMGSIVQKAADSNVALIKEKSGSVRAVKPGHIIANTYKVIDIHEKYMVVITRSAEQILVYQDKFATEFSGGTPVSTYTGPNLALQETYKEDGFERRKGQVSMSASFRDKIVKQDLAKVLMQATAEPHMENGQIAGFKLSQIDADSIFAKGGLMDEDIITAINGTKLNSVAGAIALLRSLKEADSIEVEMLRGGSPSKISLNVN